MTWFEIETDKCSSMQRVITRSNSRHRINRVGVGRLRILLDNSGDSKQSARDVARDPHFVRILPFPLLNSSSSSSSSPLNFKFASQFRSLFDSFRSEWNDGRKKKKEEEEEGRLIGWKYLVKFAWKCLFRVCAAPRIFSCNQPERNRFSLSYSYR